MFLHSDVYMHPHPNLSPEPPLDGGSKLPTAFLRLIHFIKHTYDLVHLRTVAPSEEENKESTGISVR